MNNSNESEDILLTFLNEHIHKPLENQQKKKLESIKGEIDASISENLDVKDIHEKVKILEGTLINLSDSVKQISQTQKKLNSITSKSLSVVNQNNNQLQNVTTKINSTSELIPDVKIYLEKLKEELEDKIESNNQKIIKLGSEQNDRLQETMSFKMSQMNKKLIYLLSGFAIQLLLTIGYIIYLTI